MPLCILGGGGGESMQVHPNHEFIAAGLKRQIFLAKLLHACTTRVL
jgi:hypothetical protein